MSGSKADILCSPHHGDRFVVFGQELNLYKVSATSAAEHIFPNILGQHKLVHPLKWTKTSVPHLSGLTSADGICSLQIESLKEGATPKSQGKLITVIPLSVIFFACLLQGLMPRKEGDLSSHCCQLKAANPDLAWSSNFSLDRHGHF